MGFDDSIVRHSSRSLQAVDVLCKQLQQQTFVVQQSDEGMCDGWSELARVKLMSKCVEGLWVLPEEADVNRDDRLFSNLIQTTYLRPLCLGRHIVKKRIRMPWFCQQFKLTKIESKIESRKEEIKKQARTANLEN